MYYQKNNPDRFVIKEMSELKYLKSEKWIVPTIGIFLILVGIGIMYHRLMIVM